MLRLFEELEPPLDEPLGDDGWPPDVHVLSC
jgi:hypothetical protein